MTEDTVSTDSEARDSDSEGSLYSGSEEGSQGDSLAEVTWYPLLGQSDDMAFFSDLPEGESQNSEEVSVSLYFTDKR